MHSNQVLLTAKTVADRCKVLYTFFLERLYDLVKRRTSLLRTVIGFPFFKVEALLQANVEIRKSRFRSKHTFIASAGTGSPLKKSGATTYGSFLFQA